MDQTRVAGGVGDGSGDGRGGVSSLGSGGRRAAPAKPSGSANEAITLGFIGVGGMGTGLLNIFKGFPDVRVAAVCDVYEPHVAARQVRSRR